MNTKHLLHRELHPILEAVPPFQFRLDNLERFRSARATAAVLGDADAAGVRREAVIIKSEGLTGDRYDMSCLLYTPKQPGTTGAYLHIHGGGYIGGRKEYSDPMNTRIAATLGVTVLAVGYRLAPEHPVPAPLDDCYSALAWLHTQAAQLGIDPARIAVGGESAGGGLAAALAIRARDEGKYPVCHQHLTYPMLDDRTGTPAHFGDPLVGEFVWNRDNNRFGWSSYLGEHPAQAPYVPARVVQVEGSTAHLDVYGLLGPVSR
jgi:acetyl esterase/lipase